MIKQKQKDYNVNKKIIWLSIIQMSRWNNKESFYILAGLGRLVPEVFGVKVQYGDCYVVAEQTNDVRRQRKQMKQSSIVYSVIGAA